MGNSLLLCVDSTELFAFDISNTDSVQILGSWPAVEFGTSGCVPVVSALDEMQAKLANHFGSKRKLIKTVFGLDSTQIICFPSDDLDSTDPYHLEQILPIDAENVSVRQNDSCTLVAIRNRIQPLVEFISQLKNFELISIAPTDLLLAVCEVGESLQPEGSLDAPGFVAVEPRGKNKYDSSSEQQLIWQPERGELPSLVQCSSGLVTSWTTQVAVQMNQDENKWPFFGQLQKAVAAKTWKPERQWFNFLDDFTTIAKDREQAAVGFVWIAALLFLLSTAGAMILRSSQVETQAIQIDNSTYDSFRTALPEFAKSRLYERKLKSVVAQEKEIDDWIEENLATEEILVGLYEVLDSLPAENSFETTLIKLKGNQVELEGKVTELSDLDEIRDAFEQNERLREVDQTYGLNFRLAFELQLEGSQP